MKSPEVVAISGLINDEVKKGQPLPPEHRSWTDNWKFIHPGWLGQVKTLQLFRLETANVKPLAEERIRARL